MNNKQKFPIGSRVHICKDLGSGMSHFKSDCDATVKYTYNYVYGGNDTKSYCLDIDNYGESSWYREWQLTAIEPVITGKSCELSVKEYIIIKGENTEYLQDQVNGKLAEGYELYGFPYVGGIHQPSGIKIHNQAMIKKGV